MPWNSIDVLTQAIPDGEADESWNIDGLLMAVAEDVVEAAAEGAARDAVAEFERLQALYDGMARRLPLDVETSPAFRAGQVAMAVEVLGALKDRAPSAAFEEQLRAPANGRLLSLLLEKEHRNVDLARRLGKDAAQITRMLKPLREAGVVVTQKSGREVHVRLGRAARAELEGRPTAGEAVSPAERYHRRMQGSPVRATFARAELPRLDLVPVEDKATAA
ncbi:winged helix-turn-helix transcriptional regulator [Azospirillum sp. RWY-5-1]|uniref:Winged helix-turn-helix transcriptional regulator n=1 Tax=Azospirillum oleiclasticum TaxID=2735135 RepID=A0ABX2T8P2_9PROT|nr:winged helix-turn-helix domain-containing protein [Azospirillum oleiclasticum]NYZ13538.1 winged helix-turn-helix transcriptional regulator [Azospirillum oleiclasticum]NYZ20699.1 winged helix-turn-helix transcriptional regulator [Azospirillum oleiclasticum]